MRVKWSIIALAAALGGLWNAGCSQSRPPVRSGERARTAESPAHPSGRSARVQAALGARQAGGTRNANETAAGQSLNLPPPYATPPARNFPRVAPPSPGARPTVPAGYGVTVWATDARNPRHMALSPNGDVFVVESDRGRIRIYRPSGRNYGKPAREFVYASGLHQPFGLAFYKGYLYVGDTDAVVRFPYRPGDTRAEGAPQKITDLTPGGYNQHWTRNVLADPKRNKLYVSVGSRTNDSVEGPPRASILEMNPDGSGRRTYAYGLRNPVGLALNPDTGKLWTAVNERDNMGDDVPPDYATEVKPGAFYGWPYAYIGPHPDPHHRGERPDLVAKTVVPDVLLGPHVAALNIAFNPGTMLPGRGDAFVALHGSWNRSRRSGYSVVRIPMRNGRPAGPPQDFMTGFILPGGDVWGRPVGLLFLPDGSLLVSEDGNNVIYRVTYRR